MSEPNDKPEPHGDPLIEAVGCAMAATDILTRMVEGETPRDSPGLLGESMRLLQLATLLLRKLPGADGVWRDMIADVKAEVERRKDPKRRVTVCGHCRKTISDWPGKGTPGIHKIKCPHCDQPVEVWEDVLGRG